MSRLIDLTGKTFGKLTVIRRAENRGKQPTWLCKCSSCGKEIIIQGNSLSSGKSTSCGFRECGGSKRENLLGQRFGKLKVIESAGLDEKSRLAAWLCECDCGGHIVVQSNSLRRGHTQSCGCVRSFMEIHISKILTEWQVIFRQQVTFSDLKSIKQGSLKFDFAIYNQSQNIVGLIEYNGQQHYDSTSSWFDEAAVVRDNQKKEYAMQNNIPLLILTKDSNIESELKSFFSLLGILSNCN